MTEVEIEEQVAKHNRFFQLTSFTLDDLDAYAEPFANLLNATYGASQKHIGRVTVQDAMATVPKAIEAIMVLEAAMEVENAA